MEIEDVKTKLRDYILKTSDSASGDPEFTDDVHLFDYGYVDSFGAVDLLAFVEKTFEVKVSQGDLIAYPLNTITEIANFTCLRKSGEL